MDYKEFSVNSPLDGKNYHCRFYTLVTGIAPRHSDTVDVKFLVNGKGVVVALAHPGLVGFRRRTGQSLTDADIIQIAGLSLKELLERGDWVKEPLITLTPEQTLEQVQKLSLLASR